jgi:hypothetical protein
MQWLKKMKEKRNNSKRRRGNAAIKVMANSNGGQCEEMIMKYMPDRKWPMAVLPEYENN